VGNLVVSVVSVIHVVVVVSYYYCCCCCCRSLSANEWTIYACDAFLLSKSKPKKKQKQIINLQKHSWPKTKN